MGKLLTYLAGRRYTRNEDERALGTSYALLQFGLDGQQHELGLIDRRYADAVPDAPGSAVLYWHVHNLPGAVRELLAAGAREHQPITERGPGIGFVTASVSGYVGQHAAARNTAAAARPSPATRRARCDAQPAARRDPDDEARTKANTSPTTFPQPPLTRPTLVDTALAISNVRRLHKVAGHRRSRPSIRRRCPAVAWAAVSRAATGPPVACPRRCASPARR
ncbi:hypothetical protein GCM10023176_23900 [Micromonospora coerulea]|uniref:Uncharacterized protein n=1 Tax=Micromonospora coerulea TaxID=47856 RepID=A0ABP8SIT5_9ACTN